MPHNQTQAQGAAPLRFAELLAATVQPAQVAAAGAELCGKTRAVAGPAGERDALQHQPDTAVKTTAKQHICAYYAHRRMGPVSTMLLAPHSMPACRPVSTRLRARARGPRSSRACRRLLVGTGINFGRAGRGLLAQAAARAAACPKSPRLKPFLPGQAASAGR